MKINSISLISIVSTLACVSTANAGVIADFYAGALAGVGGYTTFVDHKNSSASSRVFGAIAGMDVPFIRIEGEYNYFDSKKLDTNAAMLNIYAKMPTTLVMPYIGGGVGMVFDGDYKVDNTKTGINSGVAYQAMLGTTLAILAVPIKFDIEGRALYAPDILKVPGSDETPDLLQYQVRVKARFIF